ncbi:heme exporter protein CcmD [Rhodobacterales bacterium HKCCE3408]|nr:heme exporter protein CcmD [Rhodobacterales bacterium HKCCE3408]
MMPDLGQYAVQVLAAYGASLVLLAGLIVVSVWQARRVRRRLDEVEARRTVKP